MVLYTICNFSIATSSFFYSKKLLFIINKTAKLKKNKQNHVLGLQTSTFPLSNHYLKTQKREFVRGNDKLSF